MVVKALIGAFLPALTLFACVSSPDIFTPPASFVEFGTSFTVHHIVVHEPDHDVTMPIYVFLPPGTGPFPLVLFAHGRNGNLRKEFVAPIAPRHVRYWLQKGYVVVAPLRPGYGPWSVTDYEMNGDHYGKDLCLKKGDPGLTIDAAKRAMYAAYTWARSQSFADPERILLEGVSVGGMAVVAMGAEFWPGVVGYINFSGGAGGSAIIGKNANSPRPMCAPERVKALMEKWGTTSRMPNIWLYAENDLFWGPTRPEEWHIAFVYEQTQSKFIHTPAVPNADGHRLLNLGAPLWQTSLNDWLKEHHFE